MICVIHQSSDKRGIFLSSISFAGHEERPSLYCSKIKEVEPQPGEIEYEGLTYRFTPLESRLLSRRLLSLSFIWTSRRAISQCAFTL